MLLVYAQKAFRDTVDKNKLQDIENSWAIIESTNAKEFKDVKVRYKYFKEHYTMHLQNLVKNEDPKQPQPQAHIVDSHGSMIADLQGTMQSVVEDQNHVRDQYAHRVEAAYNARVHPGPPSVVATTSTSTTTSNNSANTAAPSMSYNDVQEMIKKAIQGVTATPQETNNNSNRKRQNLWKGKGKWRQWRSWCYTCGVNLTRNTEGCRQFLKAPKHKTCPDATKNNLQGGNGTRNHLWMKWCHPVTNKVHDTKGE